MKKVLHVTVSNAVGGAETLIFSITDNLKSKYNFQYLCPNGKVEEILKDKNIEYSTFKNMVEVRKIIKEIDPDVVHAHDFTSSVLCGLFAGNRKIISHLHTNHRWLKGLTIKSIIYYLISFRFKNIVIVSRSMANNMYFYNRLKEKCSVLINPVDSNKILDLSNKYSVKESYELAFLGRLSDYKDPLKFIEVVNEVKKKYPSINAVIVGDGELKEMCKTKVEALGLCKNIEFKGFLKNPFPIIKNTKILVMTSKIEALGLSAMESMCLSKPVIASNVGGFIDFINEDNGALCTDIEEFVWNIDKLLSDEKEYIKYANNALKTSGELPNIDKYIHEIHRLYK